MKGLIRPKSEVLALDGRALVMLLTAARQVVADETHRCQEAFAADAAERQSQRAATARHRHPEAPWRWYQDPDVAAVEAALDRLPTVAAVQSVFGLADDAGDAG